MIRELTASAWSVLSELHEEEVAGLLTTEQAQERAVARIRDLRYGQERKDYFWITDMTPRMIMHPYRTELDGVDLNEFQDERGTKLFVEFVKAVKANGEGYVEYKWQWKDDKTRIVPKLSYVRGFEPWGWIVGTGIYIEDVKEEIAAITGRLIRISLVITIFIALLLFFNMHQSLRIEQQRRYAEDELRESKDKYQALVEAATEGVFMLLEGRQAYSNKTLADMLDYSEAELAALPLNDIFPANYEESPHATILKDIIAGKPADGQFETQLVKKGGQAIDVVLAVSEITFAEKQGIVITARDISQHKEVEVKLGETEAQYRAITDSINIGVFRSTLGRKGRFLQANAAAMRILGFQSQQELVDTNLADLFHDADDRESFFRQLQEDGEVKNRILRLKRKDGSVPVLSLSAITVKDEKAGEQVCDGVMEDITERKRVEEEREGLIVELQTAMLFLNQPVRNSVHEPLFCDMNMPISKVASLMAKSHIGAALVRGGDGETIGIITDWDLRERVVAAGRDANRPAFEIMSSPLIDIPDRALLFEAALLMQEKGTAHLVVRNSNEAVVGMLSSRDLLQVHRYSSSFLLRELHQADSVDDLAHGQKRLPRLAKALMDSGANSRNIVRIIASVSDAITNQVARLAIEELGPPPVDFALLALGSVGREEQTLKTDQDNAIVYDDVPADREKEVEEYFVRLGERICESLAATGYSPCAGEVMGSNPRWCRPLSEWKNYFTDWIRTGDPNDLIAVSIFFDFRCVYGSVSFAEALHEHVAETARGKAAFFQHLAMNSLQYKPPIGFFGKIVVGESEEQPETFDIKKVMMPIIDFARIYSLQRGFSQANTHDRLARIAECDIINDSEYEDIVQAYDYLMTLRLKHQTRLIGNNENPDNYINPKDLAQIELATLKKTLTQISELQNKLKVEFTGTA